MNRETDSFRAIARQKTRASRASRFSRLDQYGWTSEHLDDPHLADWLITTLAACRRERSRNATNS